MADPDTFAAGVCHLASVPPEHLMIYKDGDEVHVPDRFMALYAKLKLKYGTLLPHPSDVDSSNVYSKQALLGILNLVYEMSHTKSNEFNRTLLESWMESAKSLRNLGIDISWLTEKLELLQQVLVIREMTENAGKLTEVKEMLDFFAEKLVLIKQVYVNREMDEKVVLVLREIDEKAAKLVEGEEKLVRLKVEKQNLMCSVKDCEANLLRLDKKIQQVKDEKEVYMQEYKEYSDMADKLNVSALDGLL